MKRLIALLLAVMMILTLASCAADPGSSSTTGDSNSSTSSGGTETEGLKVASINAYNHNGWRMTYENDLKAVADEYMKEGIISKYDTFCPNGDQAQEVQMFETAINEGYDIILINAIGATGLDPQIAKALDQGITVVSIDNLYDYDGVLKVQTDQRVWAGNNAKFICEQLGGKGKVVLFTGMPGVSGSNLRYNIFMDVLSQYPDIETVGEYTHNWSQVDSKQAMSEFLASGIEYDAILTEEACVGILQAIQEAGAPYPKAITSDEEVGYLRMLGEINKDELVLPFYIIENPPGIGATALKLAVRKAQGKEFKEGVLEDDTYYYEPTYIITYENMEEEIEKTKDMAETDQISSYLSEEEADALFQ